MAQTYCTADDVYFVLSQAGATACVDDEETGVLSAEGEGFIASAIEIAAADVNQKVRHQYKLSQLSGNTWLKWCNAYLAAKVLATRRGNPCPEQIVADVEKREELLEQIRWGREKIPEQLPSFDNSPAVTNYRPELGKVTNPIRVDTNESTGDPPPSEVQRHIAHDPSWY